MSNCEKEAEERFWIKVKKTKDCWLWTAYKDKNGYGRFWFDKKLMLSHRFSWEIKNGKIKEGMFACHSCDNPTCVNPDHLFIGTCLDNMRDAKAKGKYVGRGQYFMRDYSLKRKMENLPRGENHPNSKMTEKKVIEARKLREMGFPIGKLARKFGLTYTPMYMILKRKHWRNV